MGALGCPRDGQGPFQAAATKSPLHTHPVQIAGLSVVLVWPCKVVPVPSWGRERWWHQGRADLCRTAQQEPIVVLVQRGWAPAPGLRLL